MNLLRVPATIESLELLRRFIVSNVKEHAVPLSLVSRIELVLEELVVNATEYAYNGAEGDIELECRVESGSQQEADKFCFCLRDWSEPFNPLEYDGVPFVSDIEGRLAGGLGLLFAREFSDTRTYRRVDDCNEICFCFTLS